MYRSSILNKTIILLNFLLVSVISGCKKEEYPPKLTKIHGYLVVKGSMEIINDRPYKIGMFYGGSELIAETYTDENGYFEFTIEEKEEVRRRYRLRFLDEVPDDTFWEGGGWQILDTNEFMNSAAYFPAGYHGRIDMGVAKKAWLKLHVENMTPQFGDVIWIIFRSVLNQRFYHAQNFYVILPGEGNVHNRLDFYVTKPGVYPHLQTRRILLKEMDTTYYKLEY
jgi:hypothetical protein